MIHQTEEDAVTATSHDVPSLQKDKYITLIHRAECCIHCIMFYRIKAFGRKYGWILLGSTQADTYFVFCQVLDIAFENHFIGNVICIAVTFIKDNGVALTEIRREVSVSRASLLTVLLQKLHFR